MMTLKILRIFAAGLCFSAVFSAVSDAAERYVVKRPVLPPEQKKPVALPEMPVNPVEINWETDYAQAVQTARNSCRPLLIYFRAEPDSSEQLKPPAAACAVFDAVNLNDPQVCSDFAPYVMLKLPMDAEITGENGTEQTVLSLPEFSDMAGRPGLAIVDFADESAEYYGQTTGVLPFGPEGCPTSGQTAVFLNLPQGPITQRMLIYAVRTHRDHPRCTEGEPLPVVVQTATDHAKYQAEKNSLGHQNFGTRSQAVIKVLGSGSPSEICAQIPVGESIYDSAIRSMRAWRNSSGHWAIARKPHKYYGFDMMKNKNGSWFAVGFFID
ncbi:MAG: hypothetical protein LBH00_07225 [Planctomycetaceae bacterium]|nr:hypothetical protein [Planctomycetaceae bacterium]